MSLFETPIGLHFMALVDAREDWIADTLQRIRRAEFGISVSHTAYMFQFETIRGSWTKVVLGAELEHLAIERSPALPNTVIRVDDEAEDSL